VPVDLSGVIFVVLAVAWAGYLIPRALRHHEQVAANRPVESFSDTMRVLERTPATMRALMTPPTAPAPPSAVPGSDGTADRSVSKEKRRAERTQLKEIEKARRAVAPRPSTRGAAVRRRRVLLMLALVTAVTAGAAGLAYVPWYSVAVAGSLVVAWLVLCVLMARKSRLAARRPVAARRTAPVAEPAEEMRHEVPAPARVVAPAAVVESDDDDGSLWDPLPLTLPTYVTKPAARRTVRTIDLTQTGVTSSGHQAADSRLARAAEADAKAAAKSASDQAGDAPVRRASGA
jgi:hypothetical protein